MKLLNFCIKCVMSAQCSANEIFLFFSFPRSGKLEKVPNFGSTGKHKVGFSWQVLALQTKPETHSVKEGADRPLGRRIGRVDQPHDLASFVFREGIHVRLPCMESIYYCTN